MVYVSGASDKKPKCPDESLVAVALCDALLAVTVAFATGAPVPTSVTVPLKAPVVPARRIPVEAKKHNTRRAQMIGRREVIVPPPGRAECGVTARYHSNSAVSLRTVTC